MTCALEEMGPVDPGSSMVSQSSRNKCALGSHSEGEREREEKTTECTLGCKLNTHHTPTRRQVCTGT